MENKKNSIKVVAGQKGAIAKRIKNGQGDAVLNFIQLQKSNAQLRELRTEAQKNDTAH
ncbi:MAG: hypothetical protein ACPGXZ_06050 [Saprospiraceae bacterium]